MNFPRTPSVANSPPSDSERARRAPAAGVPWVSPEFECTLGREVMRKRWLHEVVTFLMMPLAWRLGPRINYVLDDFYVEVPHRRINRNYYGTIAGAALLANLEIAAGAFINLRSGGRHRLVCRNINYRFMLPSTNGLHFRVEADNERLDEALRANEPFNADLKVVAYTLGESRGQRGARIGRGDIRFHVWPVVMGRS